MILIVDLDSLLLQHIKISKQKNIVGVYFDFFNHFFVKYPSKNGETQFIFILQKIGHVDLLCKFILEKYSTYNIRFVIVENRDNLFVCHYFYHLVKYYEYEEGDNNVCQIVSNAQYTQIKKHLDSKLTINVLKMFGNHVQTTRKNFTVNELILSQINKITIPYNSFYLTSII